jgi:hypothetical protein
MKHYFPVTTTKIQVVRGNREAPISLDEIEIKVGNWNLRNSE